jgi:hypothetical protein
MPVRKHNHPNRDIESSNPAVHGMAEATLCYAKYLYALAIA